MACPMLSSSNASVQLTGEPSNCRIQYTSTVPTNQPIRLAAKLAATASAAPIGHFDGGVDAPARDSSSTTSRACP